MAAANKLPADDRQKVVETIVKWGTWSHTPATTVTRIVDRLLPSIRLLARKKTKSPKGGSRLGGLPDLPAGAAWPRVDSADPQSPPLSFVLQVNLAEVAALDSEKVLPAEGLLSLFYYWDDDAGGDLGRVLFFPAPVGELDRLKAPDDLPKDGRYRPFALEPRSEWTVPRSDGLGLPEKDEPDLEAWWELSRRLDKVQGLAKEKTAHRMLGHPDFIQSSGLGRGQVLLLQAASDDSDDGPGISWGDGGIVYCILRTADLRAARLDRARVQLEMG